MVFLMGKWIAKVYLWNSFIVFFWAQKTEILMRIFIFFSFVRTDIWQSQIFGKWAAFLSIFRWQDILKTKPNNKTNTFFIIIINIKFKARTIWHVIMFGDYVRIYKYKYTVLLQYIMYSGIAYWEKNVMTNFVACHI